MSAAPTTMEWIRQAAARIRTGTAVLARRLAKGGTTAAGKHATGWKRALGGWLGESDGGLDTVLRWVFLAVGAFVVWTMGRIVLGMGAHAISGARWMMWPAAGWFLVAAYRAGKPAPPAAPPVEDAPAAEAPPKEEPGPQIPDVPRTVFLALLHGEIGTGRAVHLAHVAKVLTERGPAYPWDVPAVTILCHRHGIPVEKKVRAHGRGATRGVLKSALPAASEVFSWDPVETVDTAGQGSSTDPSTSTSTEASTGPEMGDGEEFVTGPDPDQPYRTWVKWLGRKAA